MVGFGNSNCSYSTFQILEKGHVIDFVIPFIELIVGTCISLTHEDSLHSCKSYFDSLIKDAMEVPLAKLIWKAKISPKVHSTAWLAMPNKVNVKSMLQARKPKIL